jgi:pimeloyl-ACP methyl ester carboxylesterase
VADGLLLLHAFPVDARMWEPQRAGLRGRITVAPDHPGFGASGRGVPDVLTMELAASSAVRALDRAKIDRAVVCGLSMGGYVAFELWRRARERIAGLVLANTRAAADTAESAAGRRALAERLLGMAERPDSTPDLPGIDVPTLVVTSSDDTLIPAEVSAPMAEQIPGAHLAVIEGAGHLSNLERAEEFTRLLDEHLTRCGL